MTISRIPCLGLATLASVILSSSASASVTIDWVPVGNAGNAADIPSYGAVPYVYQIGKYEVTNAQYAEFLNAKAGTDSHSLYNASMSSYGITQVSNSGSLTYSVTGALANRPVVYVSWFDAARFANWMVNGQGAGDTETGAYTLNGAASGVFTVNVGAQIHLPSEDEWYKAAYFDPTKGISGGYWTFPTTSDTISIVDANYGNVVGSSTDVGAYTNNASFYGTFDQAGNVYEWNDAAPGDGSRVIRGGSWGFSVEGPSKSSYLTYDPTLEFVDVGFRVVSVPEASAVILTTLACGALTFRRKR